MRRKAALTDQVSKHFEMSPPSRLGVAVSGGSDSLALLHILHDWDAIPLEVVTVDHGLRAEAAVEAAHVGAICAALGRSHSVLRWEGWDGAGNLQDQARRSRYSLIAEWAQSRDLDAIALGHTLDDQAETFVMRLARGAGVDGLAAMRPMFHRDGMRFDRPLLPLRRQQLREFLSSQGIQWVEDPSNDDTSFERVRVRHALAQLAPLGLDAAAVAESSHHLRDASDALSETARKFAEDHVATSAGDLVFDRTLLCRQPRELRRRLLAGALNWVASAEYSPRRVPMEALLVALDVGRDMTLHGCSILMSDTTLRIAREFNAVASLPAASDQIWDSRWWMDGAHAADLQIRALGDALNACPDWRETGIPRGSLRSSPAIWRGETLVAAPLAGLHNGWSARFEPMRGFAASLIAH